GARTSFGSRTDCSAHVFLNDLGVRNPVPPAGQQSDAFEYLADGRRITALSYHGDHALAIGVAQGGDKGPEACLLVMSGASIDDPSYQLAFLDAFGQWQGCWSEPEGPLHQTVERVPVTVGEDTQQFAGDPLLSQVAERLRPKVELGGRRRRVLPGTL